MTKLQASILNYLSQTTLEKVIADRERAILAADNPEQECLFCGKLQRKKDMRKVEANRGEIYWSCNPLCDQGRCTD
ncbi:hypothetical protein KAR91_59610 [Candidatus Pacearchaeota archaeon]|nr:hypothetical protein [Candidatus Pacearchaeota archaeon]